MRIIQLGFQLHEPFGTEDFARANKEIYQPFLALLERNTQKYGRNLKISLVMTGSWLVLAEKHDKELLGRLRKLVKQDVVELVGTTNYHSLAPFYNLDEATTQVEQYQEKLERIFDKKARILVLPELAYSDKIGQWAEEIGFAGMLVGGGQRALGWRSANHVYEAAGCKYLRLLFQNVRLSRMAAQADKQLLAEKKSDDGETKLVLSAQRFQKVLDLECLRGNLINLYWDAQVIRERRRDGIIGFFDELFENWLAVSGNRFVGAMEACVVETPTTEVSVKEATSWRERVSTQSVEAESENQAGQRNAFGLVLEKELEVRPPQWLDNSLQRGMARKIYGLRKEILASEDEALIDDFRKLTAIEVLDGLDEKRKAELETQVADLRKRANEVKKTQAVEISRAYTKKRDRGDVEVVDVETKNEPQKDVDTVSVSFGVKRGTGVASGAMHSVKVNDVAGETAVPVRRLTNLRRIDVVPVEEAHEKVSDEATEVQDEGVETENKADAPVQPKLKKIRKIIKRLVIE